MKTPMGNLTRPASAVAVPMPPLAGTKPTRADVVVLGISTGGPQALRRMMPLLPKDFPVPFAIVLHMPIGYTALYAEKLNEICAVQVKEAADGDILRPGLVLLAQAGRHLTFKRLSNGEVSTQLSIHPMEKLHRPSVDVLFQSAAEIFGSRTLAVVMTGMGDDGKEGCAWIKAQGGTVITEAENSCVIYGMPRSVAEAGLSDVAVPLDQMAPAILSHL
jgi:two-component system, chemotaxis family, protein-glutamate methylesterase/glutaminase